MSVLFRFEDTHGAYTLFAKAHSSDSKENGAIFSVSEDIYCQIGIGNKAIFKITAEEWDNYKIKGITSICFVFDVDHISDLDKIMTIEHFEKWYRILEEQAKEYDTQIRFIPCIYEAESIVLYQHSQMKQMIPSLVNKWSTRKAHQYLLCLMQKCRNIKDIKSFKFDIDLNKILSTYDELEDKDIFNQEAMKLLRDEIMLNTVGMKGKECISLLARLHIYFNEQLNKGNNIILFHEEEIDILNATELELERRIQNGK